MTITVDKQAAGAMERARYWLRRDLYAMAHLELRREWTPTADELATAWTVDRSEQIPPAQQQPQPPPPVADHTPTVEVPPPHWRPWGERAYARSMHGGDGRGGHAESVVPSWGGGTTSPAPSPPPNPRHIRRWRAIVATAAVLLVLALVPMWDEAALFVGTGIGGGLLLTAGLLIGRPRIRRPRLRSRR